MTSTSTRVIKNTAILYIKMFVTMFISLYTTRLILNSLGVTDFGIYNVVVGAIAMLTFLNAAMTSATQRFMSFYEGKGDKEKQKIIFNISFVIHIVIAISVGVLLELFSFFLFNGILRIPQSRIDTAKIIYQFMIVSTMFTIMTVPYDAVVNAHENMFYYSIVGILEAVLKLGVAFVVVYTLADKLIIYGLLMASITLTVLIVMRIYCHHNYVECYISPRKYFDKKLMKEMVSFAGWNFLSTSSMMIANYGLGIVVNSFFGVVLNSALGIAQQLDAQLKSFSNTMLKALNPIIDKNEGNGNREMMLHYTMIGSKFSFFLFAFFAIPVFIEMPTILRLWLKNIPDWTVLFCRLQLIASLIGQIGVTLPSALGAQGNIKGFSKVTSLLYFSSIITTFLFLKFGLEPYCMYIPIIGFGVIGYRVTNLVYLNKNCKLSYKVNCTPLFGQKGAII